MINFYQDEPNLKSNTHKLTLKSAKSENRYFRIPWIETVDNRIRLSDIGSVAGVGSDVASIGSKPYKKMLRNI